jgi:flagellar hook-associated protein 1 FlgK
MSDLFSTSVSGLLAFQRALDVTSNNISNVATPGYSKENANFTERPGQAYSSGYIGSGTEIDSVTRSYDELLAGQVRSSQSSYSSFDTYATQASQIDNMLSDPKTGLTVSLQNLINAYQTVANSPSTTAQRQALLSQANSIAQQMQNYNSQLQTYAGGIEQGISSTITQVNTLTDGIAKLNQQIAAGLASTGQTPNQLMDQRDQMLDQLSQYVSVSTATQTDGSMNVYVGTGQPLVIGATSQQLKATPNQYNAAENQVSLVSGGGLTTDITSSISGGQLGGLLAVRDQVLRPAENTLGQFSVGLATLTNQAQAAGIDLTGAAGKPMFAVGGVISTSSSVNTGTASVTTTRTNLSALTSDDYILRQSSAGTWTLTDEATNQPVTMTGTGTAADPFMAAGLSMVVTGTAAVGDSYEIRPTAGAAAGMSVLLTSPAQIAAASSIATTGGAANTGTGAVTSSVVSDPSVWVPGTYKISFTSATAYQVTDSANNVVGTGNYTSGTPITFNGASVTITGSPANGDVFNVGAAGASNVGDNSNAFALIDSLNASKMNGGTTSLSSVANNLVSQVGVQTQQAQANASAQKAVNSSAVDTRNNLSGVNLDEEAAKMVQYQQAYSACAQMIQASNTMFNALISAIKG